MKKPYRPGPTLAYLAVSIMAEQAIGLVVISRRVAFSIVPAVFIAQAPALSLVQTLMCAVGVGVLYDIRSTTPFGIYILAFLVLAATAKFLEQYISVGRFLPVIVLGTVTLAVFYVVLASARYLWGGESLWWRQIPAEVLWNVGVLFFNAGFKSRAATVMSHHAEYR